MVYHRELFFDSLESIADLTENQLDHQVLCHLPLSGPLSTLLRQMFQLDPVIREQLDWTALQDISSSGNTQTRVSFPPLAPTVAEIVLFTLEKQNHQHQRKHLLEQPPAKIFPIHSPGSEKNPHEPSGFLEVELNSDPVSPVVPVSSENEEEHPPVKTPTEPNVIDYIGAKVEKQFDDGQWYGGTVARVRRQGQVQVWEVQYQDGDEEEMTTDELELHLVKPLLKSKPPDFEKSKRRGKFATTKGHLALGQLVWISRRGKLIARGMIELDEPERMTSISNQVMIKLTRVCKGSQYSWLKTQLVDQATRRPVPGVTTCSNSRLVWNVSDCFIPSTRIHTD